MATYNVGRIMPIFKGTWGANIPYDKLDIVYFGGDSYVAMMSSTGQQPTRNNNVYWQIMAKAGADGDAGAGADIKINVTANEYLDF